MLSMYRGVENTAVDVLSHDNILIFMQVVPGAERHPTSIPEALVDLTVKEQPSHHIAFICSTTDASEFSPAQPAGVCIG